MCVREWQKAQEVLRALTRHFVGAGVCWVGFGLAACGNRTPIADEGVASAATASPAPGDAATTRPWPEADAQLRFIVRGETIRAWSKQELAARIPVAPVRSFDPYYGGDKTFDALPLKEVLRHGFEGRDLEPAAEHFVLHASDGYTIAIDGARLVGDGAHLAIADADLDRAWAPLGAQGIPPGPFYLVWEGHPSPEAHPRPYQLVAIEVARFEDVFPKTVPSGLGPDHAAVRGYATFRKHCIKCHAINQQGGRVGPELNVPQNITEYRPEVQIRAYIRNPMTFRYSKMPAAPYLDETQLDELIAYLRAMKDRKDDPAAAAAPETGVRRTPPPPR